MISYSSGDYTFRQHRRFGSVSQTASNRSGRGVWSDRGLFNVFVSSSLLEAQCISTIRAAIQEVSGNALSKFWEGCPGEFPVRSPRGRRLRQSGNRSCQIHKMILLVVGQLSAWGASPGAIKPGTANDMRLRGRVLPRQICNPFRSVLQKARLVPSVGTHSLSFFVPRVLTLLSINRTQC